MVLPPPHRRKRWFRRRSQGPATSAAGTPVRPSSHPVSDVRVAALLQEISELRLSAVTHLTIAAAAMDLGRPDIAKDLIEAQQRDMARLRLRAEELLAVEGTVADDARRSVLRDAALEETGLLEQATAPTTKSLRRPVARTSTVATLPRGPRSNANPRWSATGAVLAAAAAVVFAVVQPLTPAAPSGPERSPLDNAAVASLDAEIARSFDQLRLVANPARPQADVIDAGRRLQAQLIPLIPLAAQDPATAQHVLAVLEAGRTLLAQQSPGALAIYDLEASRIVEEIRASANPTVAGMLPIPAPTEQLVRDAVLRVGSPPDSGSRVAPAPARVPERSDDTPPVESGKQGTPQQQEDDSEPAHETPTVDLPADLPVDTPVTTVEQPPAGEQPEAEAPPPAETVPEPAQTDLPLPQLPAPPIDLEPLTGP